jgi:hypothetical protein
MRTGLFAPALPLAAIALAAGAHADRRSHGACYPVEPAVYPRRVACTTEPAPRAPIVEQRPSPRARLRVRVIGAGSLCRATWSAARAAPGSTDLTLTATAGADPPSACGTCVVDLLITRLGRGDYRVTFAGTTLRAHAP